MVSIIIDEWKMPAIAQAAAKQLPLYPKESPRECPHGFELTAMPVVFESGQQVTALVQGIPNTAGELGTGFVSWQRAHVALDCPCSQYTPCGYVGR
jgi:hypothetical protein